MEASRFVERSRTWWRRCYLNRRRRRKRFPILRQRGCRAKYVLKHVGNNCMRSGVLRNGGGGRRMVYRHVTALMVVAAHVAISAIFLQHSISEAVIPALGRQASSGAVAVRRAMQSAKVRLSFTSWYYADGRMMRSRPMRLRNWQRMLACHAAPFFHIQTS